MKLSKFYELAVQKGMKEDQRPKKVIEDSMKKARSSYRNAKGIDKVSFDKAALLNPYNDTRILYGSGDTEVKNIMVGIDISPAELLLADRLREKGKKIDLVLSHHPSGKALTQLHRVMDIQSTLWENYGLDHDVAEGIMKDRIGQVSRGVCSGNNTRTEDAARLLGIPFMCIHTAADNCVANYLQKLFNSSKPKNLKDIISALKRLPEYKTAMKDSQGPFILIGKDTDKAGKIFVDMTGGTSGPDKMFPRLSQAGVKTIVGMHCRESGFKLAKSEYIQYVIAGHISSDNLGLNLLFDHIEKKGKLKFIECSGFKRYRRK